jgi:hypothetical protein
MNTNMITAQKQHRSDDQEMEIKSAMREEWRKCLNLEFRFTLDSCLPREAANCDKPSTPDGDGLAQSWKDERVFMGPPYEQSLTRWMRKAFVETRDNGALVVCLVPLMENAEWWHEYATKGEIRYPKARLKLAGANAPEPLPVAIVIFRPRL